MTFPPAPQTPSPQGTPQGLSGCFVALLVLVGVVLTLPGLCSFIFMVALMRDHASVNEVAGLWIMTYIVAALGIAVIYYAVKNRER